MKILNNQLHLILQPQSGIGKSYIANILGQYFELKFRIKSYSIYKKSISFWDNLFESFFTKDQQVFIINISSTLYKEFKEYMDEAKVLKSISTSTHSIFNHYVFTPGRNGEGLHETLNFISTATKKRVGQGIVWENYNLGITLKEHTKGQFSCLSELPEFKNTEVNISKSILLPAESFYYKKDLSSHILSGHTFDQAINNSENNIIYRQRLYQIKKRTFEAIEHAGI